MVNPKRIEQKLPLMITQGSSLSWEYQEKEHLVQKMKHNNPEIYNHYRNKIIDLYQAFEHDVLLQKKRVRR